MSEIAEINKVAQFGAVGIAITMIIALVYIVRLVIPLIDGMKKSIEMNTLITKELADYIHMKNGDMAKAVDHLCKKIEKLEK